MIAKQSDFNSVCCIFFLPRYVSDKSVMQRKQNNNIKWVYHASIVRMFHHFRSNCCYEMLEWSNWGIKSQSFRYCSAKTKEFIRKPLKFPSQTTEDFFPEKNTVFYACQRDDFDVSEKAD